MTIERLIELSGLKSESNFETFDFAVPINPDGSYPFGGNAIGVYWKEGKTRFSIMSHNQLATIVKFELECAGATDEEIRVLDEMPIACLECGSTDAWIETDFMGVSHLVCEQCSDH